MRKFLIFTLGATALVLVARRYGIRSFADFKALFSDSLKEVAEEAKHEFQNN